MDGFQVDKGSKGLQHVIIFLVPPVGIAKANLSASSSSNAKDMVKETGHDARATTFWFRGLPLKRHAVARKQGATTRDHWTKTRRGWRRADWTLRLTLTVTTSGWLQPKRTKQRRGAQLATLSQSDGGRRSGRMGTHTVQDASGALAVEISHQNLPKFAKSMGERPLSATAHRCFCRWPQPPDSTSNLPGCCESAYIKAQPPTFRCSWNFLSWSWHRPERHTVLIPRTISPPHLSPPYQACSRSADSRSCVVCLVNSSGAKRQGKTKHFTVIFLSCPSHLTHTQYSIPIGPCHSWSFACFATAKRLVSSFKAVLP
ncbi:hypothetical protein BJX76DRAFT_162416 [Aspergillus varians]